MEHLAILSKEGDFLNKILNKEKTLESRWSKSKRAPFDKIKERETIYFKESSKSVIAKAQASKIIFFSDLTEDKIYEIYAKYNKQLCIDEGYKQRIKGSKYCTLIYLTDVKQIAPFNIHKEGFGSQTAWIAVPSIEEIRT